jgi:hypothetical protein
MLIKIKKIIDRIIYKRHPNPGRPNIICEFYKCLEGRSYNEESQVCLGCSMSNSPVERLYGDDFSGWETKFCYTYYDDDSKENSDNRR